MPGTHATLSASGAKRWMSCPPSARLEERLRGIFGDSSSPFAEEGTLAHAVSELKLRKLAGELNDFNYNTQLGALGTISPEMHRYTDQYLDVVTEKLFAARKVSKDAKLFVEQRLDFSPWVPGGFGTGDAVIISDSTLEVCDLKYGAGVPVSAVDNSQIRLYGLGAINLFGVLYDFTHVRNTIIQPRLDSVTDEIKTREELIEWGETVVRPAAELAWKGLGDFHPGDHCRFCAARAVCSARAAEAMQVFRHGFEAPGVLPDAERPGILAVLDTAEAWIKDIRAYALSQAMRGQEWKGWKLVHGRRSARKWKSPEEAKDRILRAGYSEDDVTPRKLISVGEAEKLLGKKAFSALLDGYAVQDEGALTLAPEDDKRLEYTSADADFSDLT